MLQYRHLWMLVLGLSVAAPVRAAEADKYIPGDSQVVVAVNVSHLLEAPLVKKYALEHIKEGIKKNTEAQHVLGAIGLDPLKDISSVVIAGNPSASKPENILIIMHGKFDQAKIEAAVAEHVKQKPDDVKITKEGGVTVYEFHNPNQPKPGYAAFASSGTIVASPSKEYVLDAVARKTGKLGKEFAAALAKADTKKEIWMVGMITDDIKKAMANFPLTANIATKLEALTGNVSVADGVQLNISVYATDEKAASDFGKLLEAAKGFIPQDNDMVKEVVDGLKVSNEKSTVTISAKVSSELIDKLAKMKGGQ